MNTHKTSIVTRSLSLLLVPCLVMADPGLTSFRHSSILHTPESPLFCSQALANRLFADPFGIPRIRVVKMVIGLTAAAILIGASTSQSGQMSAGGFLHKEGALFLFGTCSALQQRLNTWRKSWLSFLFVFRHARMDFRVGVGPGHERGRHLFQRRSHALSGRSHGFAFSPEPRVDGSAVGLCSTSGNGPRILRKGDEKLKKKIGLERDS